MGNGAFGRLGHGDEENVWKPTKIQLLCEAILTPTPTPSPNPEPFTVWGRSTKVSRRPKSPASTLATPTAWW